MLFYIAFQQETHYMALHWHLSVTIVLFYVRQPLVYPLNDIMPMPKKVHNWHPAEFCCAT